MEINRLLLRPEDGLIVVDYSDVAGRRRNLTFSLEGNSSAAELVAACEAQMPTEETNPARTQIEREIAEVEDRLAKLRESLGVA